MRGSSMRVRFCLLAVGILLTACATGQIRDGTYVDEAKGFAVQLPSDTWEIETGKGPDLLLRHRNGRAGALINATCHEIPPNRPLGITMRHLFFGIRAKEIMRQERHMSAQGEVFEMILRGELEDRAIFLHGYTLKGSGCVYDLVLFASPEAYSESNEEFETLVRQFRLLRRQTR